MRVLLTPEAATLLESRKSWWRANRPATAELFEQELLDAVTLNADRPELFPVALNTRGRTVQPRTDFDSQLIRHARTCFVGPRP
jgi:hypothetical protein